MIAVSCRIMMGLVALLITMLPASHAFVPPARRPVHGVHPKIVCSATPLPCAPADVATNAFWVAADETDTVSSLQDFMPAATGEPNLLISGLSSLATLVGFGLLAMIVLAVVVSTFVIPMAAQELEETARRDYPELWREYAAKLEPGETLQQRPDILQDLGTRVQQAQLRDFDQAQQRQQQASQQQAQSTTTKSSSSSSASTSSSTNENSGVIDVEVEKE